MNKLKYKKLKSAKNSIRTFKRMGFKNTKLKYLPNLYPDDLDKLSEKYKGEWYGFYRPYIIFLKKNINSIK